MDERPPRSKLCSSAEEQEIDADHDLKDLSTISVSHSIGRGGAIFAERTDNDVCKSTCLVSPGDLKVERLR